MIKDKKMNKTETFKENYSPSVSAKGKVEEFRKQFFKNTPDQSSRTQKSVQNYSVSSVNQINPVNLVNPVNPVNPANQMTYELKQRRNYSALKLPTKPFPVAAQPVCKQEPVQRQNKLGKQFNERVGNIEKINSKIQDLLQYVKKDRQKPARSEEQNIEAMRMKQMEKIKKKFEEGAIRSSKYLNVGVSNNVFAEPQYQKIQKMQKFEKYKNDHSKTDIKLQSENQKYQGEFLKSRQNKYQFSYKKMLQDQQENFKKSFQKNSHERNEYQKNQLKRSQIGSINNKIKQYGKLYDGRPKTQYNNLKKDQVLDYEDKPASNFYDNQHQLQKIEAKYDQLKKYRQSKVVNQHKVSQSQTDYQHFPRKTQIQTKLETPKKSLWRNNVQTLSIQHSNKKNEQCSIVDDQITKIKSRIQQSQNQRKALQAKFCEYAKTNYNFFQKEAKSRIIENQPQEGATKYQKKNNPRMAQRKPELLTSPTVETSKPFQLKIYPCQPPYTNEKGTTILAKKLSQQIELDQKLRKCRQKFSLIGNTEKWNALQKQLSEKGFTKLTAEQLEQELKISSDEHNPFSNESNYSTVDSISQLAQAYAHSTNFWNQELPNTISREKLDKMNFNMKDIDLDHKGYLTVEDFVCFINLFSGNFFRNRDVLMIYRRLLKSQPSSKQGVQYETFLKKIV